MSQRALQVLFSLTDHDYRTMINTSRKLEMAISRAPPPMPDDVSDLNYACMQISVMRLIGMDSFLELDADEQKITMAIAYTRIFYGFNRVVRSFESMECLKGMRWPCPDKVKEFNALVRQHYLAKHAKPGPLKTSTDPVSPPRTTAHGGAPSLSHDPAERKAQISWNAFGSANRQLHAAKLARQGLPPTPCAPVKNENIAPGVANKEISTPPDAPTEQLPPPQFQIKAQGSSSQQSNAITDSGVKKPSPHYLQAQATDSGGQVSSLPSLSSQKKLQLHLRVQVQGSSRKTPGPASQSGEKTLPTALRFYDTSSGSQARSQSSNTGNNKLSPHLRVDRLGVQSKNGAPASSGMKSPAHLKLQVRADIQISSQLKANRFQ